MGCGCSTEMSADAPPTANQVAPKPTYAAPAPAAAAGAPAQVDNGAKVKGGMLSFAGKLCSSQGCKSVGELINKMKSLADVAKALRGAGFDNCSLIIGIDFTGSNVKQGRKSFGGKSLHDLGDNLNPYQQAIAHIGETLESFDKDGIIPTFGFGDEHTKDKDVFPLGGGTGEIKHFKGVLDVYAKTAKEVKLSGPTNYAPLIRKAIEICSKKKEYHVLVIIADGKVDEEKETIKAIEEASHHPLSILLVGVGDGPWNTMHEFDTHIPKRAFDNFDFVDFTAVEENYPTNSHISFACYAVAELPDHFENIKKQKLI